MFRTVPPVAPYLPLKDLAAGLGVRRDARDALQAFATDIAGYVGAEAAFLASSGRAALYLLLRGLARRNPDRREVVLPAYTCPSLVHVVEQAELQVVLCDISPRTLDFDRDQLEERIRERTLAVVPVHPFGLPRQIHDVLAFAERAGATVIEDAAQALGARLDGRRLGSWGHFGLTSLGPGKALYAGGGGVMLANGEAQAQVLAEIWQELPSRPAFRPFPGVLSMVALAAAFWPTTWWFLHGLGLHRIGDSEASRGFRVGQVDGSRARVGRSLLRRLDELNAARNRRAGDLRYALQDAGGWSEPESGAGAEPVYLRFPVLVTGDGRRDRLFADLQAQGIGAGKMYRRPLFELFPRLHNQGQRCPGARAVAAKLLTLPTHRFVADRDVARIAATFHRHSGEGDR